MRLKLVDLSESLAISTLTKIADPFLQQHKIDLWLKRDDLIHPIISGNKWRKLKYNLDEAISSGKDTLISMGGAYSNHLHALAYVGKCLNLRTIAFVRGEQPKPLTPTLQDVSSWGMELRFISRSEYRSLRDYKHWQDLPGLKTNEYWLPEGGANPLALKGVAEVIDEIDMPYDALCVACGTGATLAGLIDSAPKHVSILGFAALKNAHFLENDIKTMLKESSNQHRNNWNILREYHGGGFAKIDSKLRTFILDFEQKISIQLEPVYTGKMLYGLYDLISKNYFEPGQRIIALHTGGLQGNRGYK